MPQSHIPQYPHGHNGQSVSSIANTVSHRADPEAWSLPDATSLSSDTLHSTFQDPFTYYKAFLNTNTPSTSGTNENDDGYIYHTGVNQAQSPPYQVAAVRLTSRSNGVPLTTIIEQGSYSTLNSRDSLLGVNRYPSASGGKNISAGAISHRVSPSREEYSLQLTPQLFRKEQGETAPVGKHIWLHDRRESHLTQTAPIDSHMSERSRIPCFQATGEDYDANERKPKGFFRGVLQNVGAATCSRSRPPSAICAPVVESREYPSDTTNHSSPPEDPSTPNLETNREIFEATDRAPQSSSSPACMSMKRDQTRSRKISWTTTQPSTPTSIYPLLLKSPLPLLEQQSARFAQSACGVVPHTLEPSAATYSREQPSFARLVTPTTRGVAYGNVTSADQLISNHELDNSAQYTEHGVSVPKDSIYSLQKNDCTWEMICKASSCSTLSTTYSGTVLGVDVDLHHETFPPMAELERQASVAETPVPKEGSIADATHQLITSSALKSLLPIAAASGIVHKNYNTPRISFFSPSGNLIQPEGSSSPETTVSKRGGSPPTSPSNYGTLEKHSTPQTVLAVGSLPPARPTLVPMTTPPTPAVPLPAHLRYRHNYPHPEQSKIESTEILIEPKSTILGCGGIVTPRQPTVRKETCGSLKRLKSSSQYRSHRSTRSFVHDLKNDANFHKSRYIALASQTCGFPQKSQTEKNKSTSHPKRYNITHMHHASKANSQHPVKLHYRFIGADTLRGMRTPTNEKPACKTEGFRIGPLVGHTLRICFCQPYDGAGVPTRTATADVSCIHSSLHPDIVHVGSLQKQNKDHQATESLDVVRPVHLACTGHDSSRIPYSGRLGRNCNSSRTDSSKVE
ncbi:hypothetical protein GQ44DRAFT_826932 [Phaeosphaeriaceae sp. PMI808]|nr:hypothetical protein GQ44DRAFT_826932 [Phaeosphaeriaceae sp. PMI808]